MNNDIELLQNHIARIRETRTSDSFFNQHDYQICDAIEHIICENAQYSEHNIKLEQALIDTDRELKEYKMSLKLACDKIADMLAQNGGGSWFYDFDGDTVIERDGFEDFYKRYAKEMLKDE